MIMGWPEMAALRAAGELAEVQLFGEVTAVMEAWIARMGLGEKVGEVGAPVAGFLR
jgi:hypothetical protein